MIAKTKRELELVRKNTIKVTDFSIEIANLPPYNDSSESVKEKLTIFIADLVKNEEDIFGFGDARPE